MSRWIAVCGMLCALGLFAQNVDKPLAFEVVSIRENVSGSRNARWATPADGYQATNTPLRIAIAQAYGVQPEQVKGLPNWAESKHYDMQAKVTAEDVDRYKKLSYEDRPKLLQAVFAERFGMTMHRTIEQQTVYSLEVAKGGAKLTVAPEMDKDGKPHQAMSMTNNDSLDAKAVTMDGLAKMLSHITERQVVNHTGLTGKYDVHLKWINEGSEISLSQLFTAMQEQLGLKAASGQGSVEIVMIDHLEEPSAN